MKFKSPKNIVVNHEKRVIVSLRVRTSIKSKLIKAASLTPQKISLAELIEVILEEYTEELLRRGDLK